MPQLSPDALKKINSKENKKCHKNVPGCWCAVAYPIIDSCPTCQNDKLTEDLIKYKQKDE